MIYLTQWLCPSRHCIIAMTWDPEHNSEAEILEKGEEYFRGGSVKRACGICNSDQIHTETGRTRYKTIKDAEPAMEALQRANMVARQILKERMN